MVLSYDITGPTTEVIMFMRHERQTWRIPAQYKCPLLLLFIMMMLLLLFLVYVNIIFTLYITEIL